MFRKKILCTLTIILGSVTLLWAGDTAVFADLGFSPDGKTYMFAQYGVHSDTLKPWAELFVVDVARNNFVPEGKVSYVHNSPVTTGQDGSGALYRILSKNVHLADQYKVDFLFQGQPLYLSLDEPLSAVRENVEFRDFETGTVYSASVISGTEGSGAALKSSFYIDLERAAKNSSLKTYRVGTPQVKRPGVVSYRIRKVVIAPHDGSMIFVIEMKKQNGSSYDIRYMVEALKL
ncbi:MAG: DUF2259 domain-containing protein [Treponema sp.]|nr:DUF2259 domain-containing protein [Treponema sp.]